MRTGAPLCSTGTERSPNIASSTTSDGPAPAAVRAWASVPFDVSSALNVMPSTAAICRSVRDTADPEPGMTNGLVFGHFGDRLGRKNILVITLIVMGAATTLIGLLPTFAQIGMMAPILLVLLRGVQGFAVGGVTGLAAAAKKKGHL